MADIQSKLTVLMARVHGAVLSVENPTRLSGGANMESWSFECGGLSFVLRRAPSAEFMEARAFGHAVEAALVQHANERGVLAPEVVATLSESDGLGTGYVMRRIAGDTDPATILADPRPILIDDFARELAAIHKICPSPDIAIPEMVAATALAELKARFLEYGGDRPIIALAIRWCEAHLPEPVEPVLVHGDFRMGNLMVGADGLTGVLDWELAHWGDAHEDLAYGCMAAWRFGHYDRPAFGIASLDDYFAAYERHANIRVDPKRFRFWLIYRTVWWALGCLQMAQFWRSGADRSLERPVIGRRTSENELDLLLLLEADLPERERIAVAGSAAGEIRRLGEPSAVELLEAIQDWIVTDVKQRVGGRDRFMAAVAMNALGMLLREQQNPIDPHDRELAEDILAGRQSLASAELLQKLRSLALRKASNDSPKYASLAAAKTLWT
jgi:aminoglycoside phosphotransferase (APT) family kinase protein